MTLSEPNPVKPIHRWIERIIYALMIAAVTISMLIAVGTIWEAFFNAPPIVITSLDPPDLGFVCAGDVMTINNDVEIKDNIIIHYFVSVMDTEGHINVAGTQRAYTDFLHPYPASFTHHLPWTVPDLPAGEYLRVFAVRKVSGNEDTIFSMARFAIGENCL